MINYSFVHQELTGSQLTLPHGTKKQTA